MLVTWIPDQNCHYLVPIDDDAVGLAIAGRRGPCETTPRSAILGQSIGRTNSTASGCDFIDPSHWRPAAPPSALHSAKHDVLLQTRMSADMAKVRQFAAQDELEDDRLADAHLLIHCFVGYVVLPQNPKHLTVPITRKWLVKILTEHFKPHQWKSLILLLTKWRKLGWRH